jgi:hypothetical protein
MWRAGIPIRAHAYSIACISIIRTSAAKRSAADTLSVINGS